MRPASVLHLYRVRLRPRLVQELLALAGITVGVALVFAALVANTSLTGSVRQLTSGIVGQTRFQLAAHGPDGFDQRLLGDVQRIAGVRAAAPILEARANVIGPNGRRSVLLVSGDPRFARLGGALLRHFTAAELGRQQALALPAPMAAALGVSLGQPVRVETDAMTAQVLLGAQLQQSDIGALVHSPVAIAPIAFAQRITGMTGRVTRIFVQPAPGQDRRVQAALVRLAAGRLNVRAADADVSVFEQAAYPTNQSAALFSVFSALVGFLFAFSAMLLTVPQRRRLIADLRMAGHESWVLVELLLFDALVLGVLGSALGLLLGDQVSRHLFGAVPGYLSFAFAIGSQRIVTWQSIAIAGGAGIVAACVAVLAPLRDIFSHNPLSPAAGRATPRRDAGVMAGGLLCLLATTIIVAAAPRAAMAGLVALTLALLLLLPLLLRLTSSALDVLGGRVKSPVPILAVLELRSNAARIRTLALAATGAIAVFATVAIGGAHADLQRGLDASARDIDSNADIWATFPGAPNAFATTPFADPHAATAALAHIPGVRAVRIYRGSFLDVGDRRAWVLAPPRTATHPIPPSQIKDGDLSLATARIRAGGWVALSEAIAKAQGVGVGDRVTLPSPVPTSFRVAAISTNLGWPPGAIVLNATTTPAHGARPPRAHSRSRSRPAPPPPRSSAPSRTRSRHSRSTSRRPASGSSATSPPHAPACPA